MSRALRRIFAGFEIGDVCTATVHLFRLRASTLIDRRIIRLTPDGKDYAFAWRGGS